MCTYHLTTTGGSTGNELPSQGNSPSLRILCTRTNKIVHGKLDSLLRRDTLAGENSVSIPSSRILMRRHRTIS